VRESARLLTLVSTDLKEDYNKDYGPLRNLYNLEAFVLMLANDVKALGRFVSDQSYTEAKRGVIIK
jgi:hypothetical protein